MMHHSNIVMSWRRLRLGNWIIGSQCKNCARFFFPNQQACPDCGKSTEQYRFSGRGKVYSHTTIFSPPEHFERQTPYHVVMVELEEGPKITAQLVDTHVVENGMNVQACVRRLFTDGEKGLIRYGVKFRPSFPRYMGASSEESSV